MPPVCLGVLVEVTEVGEASLAIFAGVTPTSPSSASFSWPTGFRFRCLRAGCSGVALWRGRRLPTAARSGQDSSKLRGPKASTASATGAAIIFFNRGHCFSLRISICGARCCCRPAPPHHPLQTETRWYGSIQTRTTVPSVGARICRADVRICFFDRKIPHPFSCLLMPDQSRPK